MRQAIFELLVGGLFVLMLAVALMLYNDLDETHKRGYAMGYEKGYEAALPIKKQFQAMHACQWADEFKKELGCGE